MCCDTSRIAPKFNEIDRTIDRTPENFAAWLHRGFQNLELLEKICEIADETFHLFREILQYFATAALYQTFRDLHHGAHIWEHALHSFCFLGDLSRIYTNKFFDKKAEWSDPRNLARISHAVGHLFATTAFLSEQNLIRLAIAEKVAKFMAIFTAVGFALTTYSLLSSNRKKDFNSDLAINLGGLLFVALPLANSSFWVTSKIASGAGIVHAWFLVNRLMTPDIEHVAHDHDHGPSHVHH